MATIRVTEGALMFKLKVTLKLRDENPKQVVIHIYFGNHQFTAPPLAVRF
jgi:hypothetical protein